MLISPKSQNRRTSNLSETTLDLIDGITIRLLDDVPGGPITKFFRFTRNTLDFDFEDESPLGETKEELLRVLGLQEEKGSSLEFLRRSYKTATWFAEAVDLEASSAWLAEQQN